MRLRKKKWSNDVYEDYQDVIVDEFEHIKGNWKETMRVDRLRLEIGSGKGDYWHHCADVYQPDGIIGMERDFTAGAIALKKLETYGKDRKRFIHNDAKSLIEMFGEGEIDVIHLNFSDPWPKTRHEKRRLTHLSKLELYKTVLSQNGEIWMKTDNVGLFNYSVVTVTQNGFDLIELDVDFRSQEKEDPTSEYERKFMEKGQPIFRAIWRKKDA